MNQTCDKKWALNLIRAVLDYLETGNKSAALEILLNDEFDDAVAAADQDTYDLWTEISIFITHGDLRKEGRDFGFANLNEIQESLNKLSYE